jgi:RNA polymerase sigma-70 factor (ECF subfamily)
MDPSLLTTDITELIKELRRYAAGFDGPVDAEDVIQFLLLKLHTPCSQIEVKNLKAWCYAVVRNRCIDVQRKKEGLPQVSLSDFDETATPEHRLPTPAALTTELTPADTYAAKENRLLLRAALESLGAQAREVVELTFFKELSHSEIAQIIGTSEVNSRKILSRALKELGVLLTPFIHA